MRADAKKSDARLILEAVERNNAEWTKRLAKTVNLAVRLAKFITENPTTGAPLVEAIRANKFEQARRMVVDSAVTGICPICGISEYEGGKPKPTSMPCGVLDCPHEEARKMTLRELTAFNRIVDGRA